jgi:hypothetical protein
VWTLESLFVKRILDPTLTRGWLSLTPLALMVTVASMAPLFPPLPGVGRAGLLSPPHAANPARNTSDATNAVRSNGRVTFMPHPFPVPGKPDEKAGKGGADWT